VPQCRVGRERSERAAQLAEVVPPSRFGETERGSVFPLVAVGGNPPGQRLAARPGSSWLVLGRSDRLGRSVLVCPGDSKRRAVLVFPTGRRAARVVCF